MWFNRNPTECCGRVVYIPTDSYIVHSAGFYQGAYSNIVGFLQYFGSKGSKKQ